MLYYRQVIHASITSAYELTTIRQLNKFLWSTVFLPTRRTNSQHSLWADRRPFNGLFSTTTCTSCHSMSSVKALTGTQNLASYFLHSSVDSKRHCCPYAGYQTPVWISNNSTLLAVCKSHVKATPTSHNKTSQLMQRYSFDWRPTTKHQFFHRVTVLRHCWFGIRKSRCWRGYLLQGANDQCMVRLMPPPPHHLLLH